MARGHPSSLGPRAGPASSVGEELYLLALACAALPTLGVIAYVVARLCG
jgi:hypothetical protein